MKQVPLNEVKDDLSKYLRLAETEDIIITRHGKPAGYLVGFEDEDDWIDYLMLRDPAFQERIRKSLQDVREGRVITFEELRKKINHDDGAAGRSKTDKRRAGVHAARQES